MPLLISTTGRFIQYDATGLPGPATIHGMLDLATGSATRTIIVGDSDSAYADLGILADISNPSGQPGANPAILKQGAGRLLLAGANTFNRPVRVSAGVLQLGSDQALGLTGAGNGTQVLSGAASGLKRSSRFVP